MRRGRDLLVLLLLGYCGASIPAAAGVVVNEFVARPGGGEGEWIELANPGPAAADLSGWTIADGTGRARRLPDGLRMKAGGYLVLAARPESLRAAFALPETVTVVRPAGWPILNDHDHAGGDPADEIVLADAAGTVVDSVAYFEAWLPPRVGQSLERASAVSPGTEAGNWGWSQDPDGATPGRANSVGAPPAGSVRGALSGPDHAEPARRPAVFDYRLPGPGTMALWLVDLEGRRVAVLRAPAPAPAVGRWIWGSDAPRPPRGGVYFLCLRWRGETTRPVRACRTVWVTP